MVTTGECLEENSKTPTSQVANEVLHLHLAVGLDGSVVEVSVEHDDGKGKQKDSLCCVELLHLVWVAHTVAVSKCLH